MNPIINPFLLAILVATAANAAPAKLFTHLDPANTGISFANHISPETVRAYANIMPSGVAAGDVDGDGLPDLYFCSMDGDNALYRNLGNCKFVDITAASGVACKGRRSLASTFADLDGDGDLDLLVGTRGEPNILFINDGKGRFTEDPDFPGRLTRKATTSIAVADIDGDGDLDIYLSNHVTDAYIDTGKDASKDPELRGELKKINAGEPASPEFLARYYFGHGGFQELGEPDDLFLNDGNGRFTPADSSRFSMPDDARPAALSGWGLGAQFRDLTGDGAPELYVCNDFHTRDRLWINDGKGRFSLAPTSAQRKMSWFSMTVDFADIDADGDFDFFVADMLSRDHARRKRQMGNMVSNSPLSDPLGSLPQVMQNTLFQNRGDGSFAEISAFAGLRASEWTWGAVFMDADLDTRPDLLVSAGMLHDLMDADMADQFPIGRLSPEQIKASRSKYPPIKTRNPLFINQGGLRFKEAGREFGLIREEISGGLILADLDQDLDLDIVISNTDAPPEIYRNDIEKPRIGVRLAGNRPNTAGIGARVELRGRDGTQVREVIAGGRLISGCDTALTFAAPADQAPFELTVRWRDGSLSRVRDVAAGKLCTVSQSDAAPATIATPDPAKPLFQDASDSLGHRHRENDFDDFKIQPLLPNRLSRLGPAACWIDIDGDSDDDLLIAGSSATAPALFENLGKGSFRPFDKPLPDPAIEMAGAVGYAAKDEPAVIVRGVSTWEDPTTGMAGQILNRQADGSWQGVGEISRDRNVSGPVALADVDRDGDLDIFLGGRVRAGRYPEPADSRLLLNTTATAEGPKFDSSALADLGLASAATFADIDDDGDPDLVVAREWGAPALFINGDNRFTDATADWGLAPHTGWWNGITAGDLDGDGRLDLVATNWGQNSKYAGAYKPGHPLRVYYGDLDASGSFDIVEAHDDKQSGRLVPERGLSCSSRAMPFVRRRTPTFAQFGESALTEIYGDRLGNARMLEAADLGHIVFLNRGTRFEAQPLPIEAQLAPAFGAAIADFDGDGHQDLALAQNFFSVQIETSRNDGGRGLLLLGDGAGKLRPMDGVESGIVAWGEGRACAVADYDADGRNDLLITQSDEQTKLFHNLRAVPGLRVRLEGGPNNPQCFGASLRAITAQGPGPRLPVTGGTGYWSQHSATTVLTASEAITGVEVRWPNGEMEKFAVPANSAGLRLRPGSEPAALR